MFPVPPLHMSKTDLTSLQMVCIFSGLRLIINQSLQDTTSLNPSQFLGMAPFTDALSTGGVAAHRCMLKELSRLGRRRVCIRIAVHVLLVWRRQSFCTNRLWIDRSTLLT